jgi:hypothetical protein
MLHLRKPHPCLRSCRLLVGRNGRTRSIILTSLGALAFDLLRRVGHRGVTFNEPPPQVRRKGPAELRGRGISVAIAKDAEGRPTYVLRSGAASGRPQ